MTQLIGIKTVSDTVLEYDGYRYEKTEETAQVGDIVRNDDGDYYDVFADSTGINDDDAVNDVSLGEPGPGEKFVLKHYPVFRRTGPASIATSLAEKRAELERLQAEIAELEAQEAEERRIKVGDFARVIYAEEFDNIPKDAIVKITEIDLGDSYPYAVTMAGIPALDDHLKETQLERLTPAEARAALIAQIDAMFDGKEAITSEA